jgi:hypothetical protein
MTAMETKPCQEESLFERDDECESFSKPMLKDKIEE